MSRSQSRASAPPGAGTVRALSSPSAAARVGQARAFVEGFTPGTELLVVAASRGAADDFVRRIALDRGAVVGLHRFSLAQLAARIAAAPLVLRGIGPSSTLGTEAVAARAAFETNKADDLAYFTPVVATPGFPRALASTLRELREAFVTPRDVGRASRVGNDLAALLEHFEAQFAGAAAADRAELFRVATRDVSEGRCAWSARPLLLLDVPCDSPAEREFIAALVGTSPAAFLTIPAGDETASKAAAAFASVETLDAQEAASDLDHLRPHLFAETQPELRKIAGQVTWFSAPGEGRECVEIARFILNEARRGVPFDEMAILLRAPQRYQGQLEHALSRAGIPAWFDRGTRRPHPAGRAFLALLACRLEGLSASRFAEYLSLAQVPPLDRSSRDPGADSGELAASAHPEDELLGAFARGGLEDDERRADEEAADDEGAAASSADSAVIAGTLRAPWKWERLLVESAVIGGADRWRRRLDGLDREYQLNAEQLRAKDPDDPKLDRLIRDRENLRRLREFALPVIGMLASWPESATWGDWLRRFDGLAPRVLRRPEEVRGVLADLRPMGAIGPVHLDEVVHVLTERLLAIEAPAPRHRYGRVFVGSPHQARGRTFRVVFVPGLAERMFPQRLREDPLLVDEMRRELKAGLVVEPDRATTERLLLRLAAGAATEKLYVSYPRVDSAEARERVPSFYGLDVMRAVTGRVLGPEELKQLAAHATDATLAWPAPRSPGAALDDFEHDLAVLAPLLREANNARAQGRARYLIQLSDTLRRSVTSRWERWDKRAWWRSDGIIRVGTDVKEALASQRLTARPYSLSALQQFAECPYRFLLSAVHRLEPFEIPQPLQRLDPLTKGSLVHRVQAEFFRALQAEGDLPIRQDRLARARAALDVTLDRVAAEFEDEVSPAIDRVWRDEIDSIRSDLSEWLRRLVETPDGWEPEFFEFAFGLGAVGEVGHDRRDPRSRPQPVAIDGRFLLRGSVDLIERKPGTRERRVTDHKTGKNRAEPMMVVGGGRVLQPVLYGLAVEAAMGDPVLSGRLSYCTSAGEFSSHEVPLSEKNRRSAVEVLEIIDRAIETGFLVAAPAERACEWCDFHVVCGPGEERRVGRKPPGKLADLAVLREKP